MRKMFFSEARERQVLNARALFYTLDILARVCYNFPAYYKAYTRFII